MMIRKMNSVWICRQWSKTAEGWTSDFDSFFTPEEAVKHGRTFTGLIEPNEMERDFEVFPLERREMKYNYNKIKEKATRANAKQPDIDALGVWFSLYGDTYWNGEYYDAEEYRVFPIFKWDEENDIGLIVGYEIK